MLQHIGKHERVKAAVAKGQTLSLAAHREHIFHRARRELDVASNERRFPVFTDSRSSGTYFEQRVLAGEQRTQSANDGEKSNSLVKHCGTPFSLRRWSTAYV